MDKYFMPIYTTVVGIVIGALVAWLRTLIANRKQNKSVETDLMNALTDGMAILLRKEIKEYYNEYENKDAIPISEWEDIELTHKVYKQLHGNHSGDRMYDELRTKHLQGN